MPKNAQTITQLHSSHMLVMFNILQARLQQYVNHELPDIQAVLEKAEEPEIKLSTSAARELQKSTYFHFIHYTKVFDYVDHNKQWKILKGGWIPDHLTCLLRNLYAGQKQQLELTWNNRLVPNE